MWTPRRMMLMLAALAACVAGYFGYAVALGSVDGLPTLPEKFLAAGDGPVALQPNTVSPTYARLAEAFGPGSEEVVDSNSYKNRVEMRDKGLVFATGAPVFDNTEMVVVSPVSVALFGKGGPLKPGEAPEISTFHADRAILRFDRKIATLQDFHEKAKLKGIELVPNPDMEGTDPRRGQIWITHNQKSWDENDKVVIRTAGRLFYQVPEPDAADDPNVAHIWTADAVEVVDRKNLPLTMRHDLPRAALARPDDLRRRGAVAGILLDSERPPPTVTAVGMQIFLKPEERKPGEKKGSGAGSSVRAILLREKVQMNLWSDGDAGLPGNDAPPAPNAAGTKAAMGPPSMPLIALMGTGAGGAALAEQHRRKSLVLVETPGSFRYDFEKGLARFDAAVIPPPGGVPNLVSVARINAAGGQDNLFCTALVLEFEKPDPAKPAPARPAKPAGERENAPALRTMTATGAEVYVSVEADNLVAQGTELKYDRPPGGGRSVTTLKGSPVIADRDGSRMRAGDKVNPGEVVIDSTEPKPGSKGDRLTTVLVRGAGKIEVQDKEQGKVTAHASWGRQLRHEKVMVGGRYQDLLKFEGGGCFADEDGGFKLDSDKIWLWLKPNPAAEKPGAVASANAKPGGPGGSVPDRLEADGNVMVRSLEMFIDNTDKLFVTFQDVPPPKPVSPSPGPPTSPGIAPAPPLKAVPASPMSPAGPGPVAAEPAKDPPNPILLSAGVIRTRVNRYPVEPSAAATPPAPGMKPVAGGSLKYELENALCEDRVDVKQKPDPKGGSKAEWALDIRGRKMNLDQTAAGSAMTVYGTDAVPAVVEFETTVLYGPQVEIDQVNNTVKVAGRGKLRMKSGGDLNGNDLATPSDLEITWAKGMKFDGAAKYAEFIQNVTATQIVLPDTTPAKAKIDRPAGPAPEVLPAPKPLGEPSPYTTRSTLQAYRLDLTFDRPVYFTKLRDERAGKSKPADDDRPKLRSAVCQPVPDDERAQLGGNPPRDVYLVEEVFDAATKYVRARRLRAKQIEFKNEPERQKQEMEAKGEGELRLLQFDNGEVGEAKPAPAPGAKPAPPEMKLTVVTFATKMVAEDKGKLFQQAKFDDGANVVQVPTTDLNLEVQLHALPKEALRLACRDKLTVSSSKVKPDAAPQQRLTAVGNAEFWNEKYQGNGGQITYENDKVVLDGTPTRLASLYGRERNPMQTNFHQAEQIVYHKDGRVNVYKAAGGGGSSR